MCVCVCMYVCMCVYVYVCVTLHIIMYRNNNYKSKIQ